MAGSKPRRFVLSENTECKELLRARRVRSFVVAVFSLIARLRFHFRLLFFSPRLPSPSRRKVLPVMPQPFSRHDLILRDSYDG